MMYYKRKLPHWQIQGAEYFITFRLSGSLPIQVVKELQSLRREHQETITKESINSNRFHKNFESKLFKKYEDLLDNCCSGPKWLQVPKIAQIIEESIHYRDDHKYDL